MESDKDKFDWDKNCAKSLVVEVCCICLVLATGEES